MNVILIGYRCSGKTSVGKILAQKMGLSFVDTDELLVEKHGRSVSEIVRNDGWDGFRGLEQAVIQEVCAQDSTVIATGGGAVLDPANVSAMQHSGPVVWLKVKPETVKQRMALDDDTDVLRPPLTSKGLYAEITAVMNARMPCYEKAMDFSIDTDGQTIIEIVEIVRKKVFGTITRPG